MDDTSLLREYVEKGSEPAFAQLVELHLDLVYSAALRRVGGDHHRAKEVAQMVFTDLVRKASTLKAHPLLAGWLHRSTRWAATGLRRAEQRRIANEQAAAIEHLTTSAADSSVAWDQISPLLDDALDALNDRDRDAVLLRFFKNQPFAEIGAKLGLSENAARMRVERALGKLHVLLTKRGITSTAAVLTMILAQNSVSAAPAGVATAITASALGSATGGSTGLAFLFMAKLQLGLVGLLIVALSVAITVQHANIVRIEGQLAALVLRRDALKDSAGSLEKRKNEHSTAIRQLEEDSAKLRPLPPLTSAQQERVRLDTIVRKGALDQIYPPLFRNLQLSPAELDTFKTLLVERNQATYDAINVAKELGLTFASHGEEKAVGESGLIEIDRYISALLGPQKFAYFKNYEATLLYRQSLPRDPTLSDHASDALLDQEIELFTKTCPNLIEERYLEPEGIFSGLPDAFLKAADPLLTLRQKQMLDESSGRIAALLRMNEIAFKAAKEGRLKLSKKSATFFQTPPKDATAE